MKLRVFKIIYQLFLQLSGTTEIGEIVIVSKYFVSSFFFNCICKFKVFPRRTVFKFFFYFIFNEEKKIKIFARDDISTIVSFAFPTTVLCKAKKKRRRTIHVHNTRVFFEMFFIVFYSYIVSRCVTYGASPCSLK